MKKVSVFLFLFLVFGKVYSQEAKFFKTLKILSDAISELDKQTAQRILEEEKFDINSRFPAMGHNLLLDYLEDYDNKHFEQIKILLDLGAEVNSKSVIGDKNATALHYAVGYGDNLPRLSELEKLVELVELLVNRGAKINKKATFGTALFYYLMDLRPESIRDHGYKYDEYKKTIRLLLGNQNINERNSFGATALLYVQDTIIAQYLIDLGANISIKDNEGRTALDYALGHGKVFKTSLGGAHESEGFPSIYNPKIARFLVEKGLDINQSLQIVEYFKYGKLMPPDIALELGFGVDNKFSDNKTYLYKSVEMDSLNYVKYLLDNQANPNIICQEGEIRKTAFYLALEKKNIPILNLLWKTKPDTNVICFNGEFAESASEYVKRKNFNNIESYITYLNDKPQIKLGSLESRLYEEFLFSEKKGKQKVNDFLPISRTGKYIVTGTTDYDGEGLALRPLEVWNTQINKKIMKISFGNCHKGAIFSDDEQLLLQHYCGWMAIYNLATGETLYRHFFKFDDFNTRIYNNSFLNKNMGVVFREADRLIIWDFKNDKVLDIPHGLKDIDAYNVAISSNKKYILVRGGEKDIGKVNIMNLDDYYRGGDVEVVRELKEVFNIKFCMGDSHVIFVEKDRKTIKVMNILTGEIIQSYYEENELNSIPSITEDGRFTLSEDNLGVKKLWGKYQQNKPLMIIPPTINLSDLKIQKSNNFSNNSQILASSNDVLYTLNFQQTILFNIFPPLFFANDNLEVGHFSFDGSSALCYKQDYLPEAVYCYVMNRLDTTAYALDTLQGRFKEGLFSKDKHYLFVSIEANEKTSSGVYDIKNNQKLNEQILESLSKKIIQKNLKTFRKHKEEIITDFMEKELVEEELEYEEIEEELVEKELEYEEVEEEPVENTFQMVSKDSIKTIRGEIARVGFSNDSNYLLFLYSYQEIEKEKYHNYYSSDRDDYTLKWAWVNKQKLVLWDLEKKRVIKEFDSLNNEPIESLQVYPIGTSDFIVKITEGSYSKKKTSIYTIKTSTSNQVNTNIFLSFTDTKEVLNLFPSPNEEILLLLGLESLKTYSFTTGKEINSFPFEGNATNIIFLSDNKIIYEVKEGETYETYETYLQILDINTGQEIARIYQINDQLLIVTLDDYYMATKKNMKNLIHFTRNEQLSSFSQFDLQYNRPDIVLKRIGLASDTLIQTYRLAYQKRLERMGMDSTRIQFFLEEEFDKDFNAPEIELIGKDNFVFEETDKPTYTFNFRATDAKYKIERIFVNVDGVPLYGAKGIILENPSQNLAEREIKVPLASGKNIITLSVLNKQGVASLEKRLEITYNPPQAKKPNLYIFSIGVDTYQDSNIRVCQKRCCDGRFFISTEQRELWGN